MASPLADAMAMLAAGRVEAVEAVLACWRRDPHPLLGELVDAVGKVAHVPATVDLGHDNVWLERAAAASAAELPALLATLAATNMHAARARVEALARRPADPRIEGALVGLLESVPYDHKQSRPLWTEVFRALRRARDPRLLPRLERLDGRIGWQPHAAKIRGRLREQVAELLAHLRQTLPALPGYAPEHADVEDILANLRDPRLPLPARELATSPLPRDRLEALLDAVYANPDDDAPRMVFADAMLERNDPRGEFVALQLRLQRDPNAGLRRREKELLASHRRAWLGDLAPIIRHAEFERGFLATCQVYTNRPDLVTTLAADRTWGTVHTYDGPAPIALSPVMRALRTLTFEARAAPPDAWQELLSGTPRSITSLRYVPTADGPSGSELHALARCTALPLLRTLAACSPTRIGRRVEPAELRAWAEPLHGGAVAARLATLELVVVRAGHRPFIGLQGLFDRATVPTLRLSCEGDWRMTCALIAAGTAYTSADLDYPEQPYTTPQEHLDHVLETLPASVRVLGVRAKLSEPMRAFVVAAGARRGITVTFGR